MILPVVAYGDPVLRKVAKEIGPDYPNLKELIANMKQTMYNASGVGIAAPQIGKSVRIFIIDATPFAEDKDISELERDQLKDFKEVFINPIIIIITITIINCIIIKITMLNLINTFLNW